jgi:hypothetical protein
MENDVKYYESYGYSHEEAVAQAKADRASTRLMYVVFRLFFIGFKLFFLLLPSIFCAALILEGIKGPFKKAVTWDTFWWLCGIVYTLECVIFFLKGWQLSLKQRANRLWIFIMAICILYCLALPVTMFQFLIVDQIRRTPGLHISPVQIMSWAGGLILGWLIFRRYNLNKDEAPKFVFWDFRLGRAL